MVQDGCYRFFSGVAHLPDHKVALISRSLTGGMAADVYALDESAGIMSASPFSSEYLGFTSVMKAEL